MIREIIRDYWGLPRLLVRTGCGLAIGWVAVVLFLSLGAVR